MNIVCLSTLSASTGYIFDRLLQAYPDTKLIRIRCDPKPRPVWQRIRRAFGRSGLRRLEQRLFYSRYQSRGSAKVQRLLYGDDALPNRSWITELSQHAVNHVVNATLIRSLQPDLMITIGAPILRPHIFSIPRLGTINVHFGIAPFYRGEDTVFWPMYYRDEHQIGVTIHQIDRGVDTGPMLAQEKVSVESQDDEWSLEAKSARSGADLLVELLRSGDLQPCWQPAQRAGKEFSIKSRHVWHDALFFMRRQWQQELLRTTTRQTIHYCRPQQAVDSELLEEVHSKIMIRQF